MDGRHWNRLQEAFTEVAELPAESRDGAIEALGEIDPRLADEVRQLLEEEASTDSLFGSSVDSGLEQLLHAAVADSLPGEPVEGQVGPYRLLRFLGEGGMGVVYLAERTDIGGSVAMKLLRDAWLSPMRRQRFAMEQKFLAKLNHPWIARIYDAGTTSAGTPWFAMEFVDGVPITEYLRDHRPVQATVSLFTCVCEAVLYAHRRAIIHRDLKPTNILVTSDGMAKLLDFGIAKQMDAIQQGSIATTAGLRAFTPAYAAPELQRENTVGVFTDVYSLGVVLYELLTGQLPYPNGVFTEGEPQRPSDIARRRAGNEAPTLNRAEWADLDAMCSRALQKDPNRRYASMDALVADLHAFLNQRPLEARKGALLYTTGKFVRRHRGVLLSIALGLCLLVLGAVLFTIRLTRARAAADRARDAAVLEATHSARIQHFTESLFTGGQEFGVPPPGVKVTAMLDRGRAEALALKGDPQLQADMFRVLGTAYLSLGRYETAEPLLRQARAVTCRPNKSLPCAQVEIALGQVVGKRGSPTESMDLLQDALRIREGLLPPDDLSLTNVMVELGDVMAANGKIKQATDLFTRALQIAEAKGTVTSELTFARDSFVLFVMPYNDPHAEAYEQQTAEMDRQLFGEQSFEYALSFYNLSNVAINHGHYEQAEAYGRRALSAIQAWSGPDEGVTVLYRERLAFILSLEGKWREAQALLLRTISVMSVFGSAPSLEKTNVFFQLGFIALQQRHEQEAEVYFNRVVSMSQQHLAVMEADLETSELGLATIYADRREFARSEAASRKVLATTEFGTHYIGAAAHAILGHALLKERKLTEAEAELQKAYQWFSHDVKIRPCTVQDYEDLAETDMRLGKPREADRIREELRTHPR